MKKVGMQYQFIVSSKVVAEANFEKGTSKLIQCDVDLLAPSEIEDGWRDEEGVVNQAGMKVQTQGLIQGLVANIHWAHQMGYWDSAEHLRYIIEYLEKGFAQANTKPTTGQF